MKTTTTAAHEDHYLIRFDDGPSDAAEKALVKGRGRTLDGALSAMTKRSEANVIRDGRLVAFWCGWRNCVAVGFGAWPEERAAVEASWGKAGPLMSRAS